MQRLIPRLGAALMLLALPGCTAALVKEAEKVQIRPHRVAEVTRAWVTTEGILAICARGWLATSTHTIEPEEFHFDMPIGQGTAGATPPRDGPPGTVPAGYVTAAHKSVARGCPEAPDGAAAVEIAVIPPDDPGRPEPGAGHIPDADWMGGGAGRKLWVLPDRAAPEPGDEPEAPDTAGRAGEPNAAEIPGPVVVRRSELPEAAILYRHDEASFDGARMAWIDPGEETGRQRNLYVLLPFTLALDLPFFFFLALIGAEPF